jgi:hypothetical protein
MDSLREANSYIPRTVGFLGIQKSVLPGGVVCVKVADVHHVKNAAGPLRTGFAQGAERSRLNAPVNRRKSNSVGCR